MQYELITLQNLHEVKLSDLIESVIYDVKSLAKNGVKLDMEDYFDTDNCAVCLGGAAVCGFFGADCKSVCIASDVIYNVGLDDTTVNISNLDNMRYLFDSLRTKDFSSVFEYYRLMTGKSINLIYGQLYDQLNQAGPRFFGSLTKREIEDSLIPALRGYVKVLRKHKL